MNKTIVYYHPRNIKKRTNRGSDIRVAKMLDAFQQLDYEVIVLAGASRTRHKKIKQLKSAIQSGLKIDYVYGESTNAPIMFAEKRFLPSNCFLDYSFFSWLNTQGIPFGVFYRDVYWRFNFLKQQLPWPFGTLLKPLYYLDWYMYDKYCNMLFLPSETMNNYLPRERQKNTYQALPPGFAKSIAPRSNYDCKRSDPLRLLYVGGIEPTVYDISPLMQQVAKRDDVKLTICCRLSEWEKYRHYYKKHISGNTLFVHVDSDGLADYYHESDIFLMVTSYSEYRDFAMPVKFFEAIGYAVPIVSMNQKEVANYIKSNDIGWVLNTLSEFDKLITQVFNDRDMLAEKRENLIAHRHSCSWDARAQYVNDLFARRK